MTDEQKKDVIIPKTDPKVDEPKEENKKKEEMDSIMKEVNEILEKHGGLESNVPVTSAYWDLLNRYRTLAREK